MISRPVRPLTLPNEGVPTLRLPPSASAIPRLAEVENSVDDRGNLLRILPIVALNNEAKHDPHRKRRWDMEEQGGENARPREGREDELRRLGSRNGGLFQRLG